MNVIHIMAVASALAAVEAAEVDAFLAELDAAFTAGRVDSALGNTSGFPVGAAGVGGALGTGAVLSSLIPALHSKRASTSKSQGVPPGKKFSVFYNNPADMVYGIGTSASRKRKADMDMAKEEAAMQGLVEHPEGLHINLGAKPSVVPVRTPRWAYMPFPSKLQKLFTKRVSFGMSRLNEADPTVTSGVFSMAHNPTTGDIPIHLWSLGTIHNKQAATVNAGYALRQDGSANGISSNVDRITDVTSNNGETIEDVSNFKLVWRETNVNLLLYQRTHQSTTFDITFFKILDQSMDPNISVVDANLLDQDAMMNYWNPIAMKYTQNPASILRSRPNGATMHARAPIRVLKKYRFTMREQLSTEDSISKHCVKFKFYPNALATYDLENNNFVAVQDVTGDGVEDDMGLFTGNNITTSFPRTTQNIFMSVAANSYVDTLEDDATNYSQPTYDIAFRSIYDAVNAAT